MHKGLQPFKHMHIFNGIVVLGLEGRQNFGTPRGRDFRLWIVPGSEGPNLSRLGVTTQNGQRMKRPKFDPPLYNSITLSFCC